MFTSAYIVLFLSNAQPQGYDEALRLLYHNTPHTWKESVSASFPDRPPLSSLFNKSAFMLIIFNWKFIQYSLNIVSVPPFPPRSSPPSHLPTHLASVCFHLHFLTQDVSPNPKLTIEIDWWHGALKILLSLHYWNSRSALPYPVLSGCWRPKLSSLVLCGSPFASESVSQTVDSSLFVLSQEYFQPSLWFLLLCFPKCP